VSAVDDELGAALPPTVFDLDEIVEGLRTWVEVESPTYDRAGVNRMMDLAAAASETMGAAVERRPGADGFGDTVVARFAGAQSAPGILVLAHLDTVHPVGTLGDALPFRREGDRLYGPGVYDMKGGTYCAVYALRQVLAADGVTPLPVTFLFVPDEEVGSPTSRGLIEAEARRHRYVLVPEPAQESGDLITGRWAFQRFVLRARGRRAHAGARLQNGRSAVREIAEQIIAVEGLSDPARDVTLSAGVVEGGTFVNVVPAECRAEVLAVTPTERAFAAIRERMLALRPSGPDVRLEVEAGPVRPLYEPTAAGLALYEHARACAREIGFDPGHGTVGGGSDGNFTGALGVPTLDGLGVCGDGFHTDTEHLALDSVVPRARLLSALLRTLR
jgi:glutamate carboxypeptidase